VALLAVVVVLGAVLRISGLEWGIPKAPHHRNYYQDERFALGLLYKMDPARLKLDPGYFINPSLHYYSMLGALMAGNAFGLGLSLPVKDASPLQPADVSGPTYTNCFRICRWLVVLEGVLGIVLMFFIGRMLYNWKAGLFAALLLAVSYPCVYQSHFITADGPAMFWLILGLFLVAGLYRSPGKRLWQVLAPIGIGLALGAKYLNVILVLPWLYTLWNHDRKNRPHQFLARAAVGLLLMVGAFLVTTPYALFSLGTFLNGDQNGFGGIFGRRGMMFYNNFPPSIVEPFALTSLAALNVVGLLAFVLALLVLLSRRKPADLLLLCFTVPFYLMLVLKSSPMLRHILPVLPFVFLACAAALTETSFLKFKTGPAGAVLLGVVALSWLGLSGSAVQRMNVADTRVQAEEWVRGNVTNEGIALPSFFPYRYTPAIDSFNLVVLNYDTRIIEQRKPEYLLMTEPEYRVNGNADDKKDAKEALVAAVAANHNYSLFKRFSEPFRLFGQKLDLKFPTEDWNYPSPEILLYRRLAQ
jgi:hypothetical protein